MRINKYLALCSVASRRKVEQLVLDNKVSVNGTLCTNLATDIKDSDVVEVNGKRVQIASEYEYYMLNKPKGYLSSVSDDRDRKTVLDIVKSNARIFPVGRLDYVSEGLLLLTNDGDLTYTLTHPKNEVSKTYSVNIEGDISNEDIEKLKNGITIDEDVKLRPCKIEKKYYIDGKTKLIVTVYEGKNREIRKMFDSLNKKVIFLKRISIGELKIGPLNRGEYRKLVQKEIDYLKSLQ